MAIAQGAAGVGQSATAAFTVTPGPRTAPSGADLAHADAKIFVGFEPNVGQTDPAVNFLARTRTYAAFLTSTEAVLVLPGHRPDSSRSVPGRPGPTAALPTTADVLRLTWVGASERADALAGRRLPGESNYFIGKDPTSWHTGVPRYADVTFRSIYPGVDLVYRGNADGGLGYDVTVAPGADPSSIRLRLEGQRAATVEADGALTVSVGRGAMREPRPVIDQRQAGKQQLVAGSYVMLGPDEVGFAIGPYDHTQPLIIDPEIEYATYLGGSDFDFPYYSVLDRFGDLFVVGQTFSVDFPTSPAAFQPNASGNGDAFVAKLSPDGSTLDYSTYLGGSGTEWALGVDVDRRGNAYVIGGTDSADFPTTPGAFQTSNAGSLDAFATKLDPSGSALVYSTYLGGAGDDFSNGGGPVDPHGDLFVVGWTGSADFPVTNHAYQRHFAGGDASLCEEAIYGCDAFVTKLNSTGSSLEYSTYLGGSGDDILGTGAIGRFEDVHVVGVTDSEDFPVTPGAFQTSFHGVSDMFISNLGSGGTRLLFSTYLGGSGFDFGAPMLDGWGNVYISGGTDSTDFPTSRGAFQRLNAGGFDGLMAKLDPKGSRLLYGTYIGGTSDDFLGAGAVDGAGNGYVSGQTGSTDFPVTDDALQRRFAGGDGSLCGSPCDAVILAMNRDGSMPLFSTYLGGSGDDTALNNLGLDQERSVTLPLDTSSIDLPTTEEAFQHTFAGVADGFAVKIELGEQWRYPGTVERGPATPARRRTGIDPPGRLARTPV